MSLANIKVFSVTMGSGGPVGDVSVPVVLVEEPAELLLDPNPGLSWCCATCSGYCYKGCYLQWILL